MGSISSSGLVLSGDNKGTTISRSDYRSNFSYELNSRLSYNKKKRPSIGPMPDGASCFTIEQQIQSIKKNANGRELRLSGGGRLESLIGKKLIISELVEVHNIEVTPEYTGYILKTPEKWVTVIKQDQFTGHDYATREYQPAEYDTYTIPEKKEEFWDEFAWIQPYKDPNDFYITNFESKNGESVVTEQGKVRTSASLSRNMSSAKNAMEDGAGGKVGTDIDVTDGNGIKTTESTTDTGKKEIKVENTGVLSITAPSVSGSTSNVSGNVNLVEGKDISIKTDGKNIEISSTAEETKIIPGDGITTKEGLDPEGKDTLTISNDGVLGLTIRQNGEDHLCKGKIKLVGATDNIKLSYEQISGSADYQITVNVVWL